MHFKKLLYNPRKGEMMVELLIAISIVVVSLLGIFALVNRALSLNRVNSEQYVATYLASEGIEVAKNIFDHGFFAAPLHSKDFYSVADFALLAPGVYEVAFDSKLDTLKPVCSSFSGLPTEGAVRTLFKSCSDSDSHFIQFDSVSGLYGYGLSGSDVVTTKFRRVVIIDAPSEYTLTAPLEFRVTSAVGWESRGGSFVVQLQDHFLPWRIP